MSSTRAEISKSENSDLKGTWSQALWSFLLPVLIFLCFRWLLIEPFVIPSGSMLPTLKVNDHLLVKKFAYGIKVPFGNDYIVRWREPQRGEIVIFQYPRNPQVFYIKRVVGVPGDTIEFRGSKIVINGQELTYGEWTPASDISSETVASLEEEDFKIYEEDLLGAKHLVRLAKRDGDEDSMMSFRDEGEVRQFESNSIIVPKDSYYVMGDNRDQSSDSRVWGFVEARELVGTPWIILMGCDKTLESSQFCHPQHFDSDRFLKVP